MTALGQYFGIVPTNIVQTVVEVADLRNFTPNVNTSTTQTIDALGYYASGDGGGGQFYAVTGAAPGTYVDDNATIFVPTGGDGSSAWLRQLGDSLNVKWFGAKGDDANDDTAAIQAAIDYATNTGYTVFIPAGIYLVSASLQFPTGTGAYSVSITGEKLESSYELYPTSYSTIIKANAAISTVFSARLNFTATLSYFCKLSNLAVDGNNLADYGYVNGSRDLVQECTFYSCKLAGIYLGDYTNSSYFIHVGCLANFGHGAILTGEFSTISVWENCVFRGNVTGGMVIYSSIMSQFYGCIFENNYGYGLQIYSTTPSPTYQILNLLFLSCYIEGNNSIPLTGYEVIISGDGGTAAKIVSFISCEINTITGARLGVQLLKGQSIYFTECLFEGDITNADWFYVGAEPLYTFVNGLSDFTALSFLGTGGPGIPNVVFTGPKGSGGTGTYQTTLLKANFITTQFDFSFGTTLEPTQMGNSVITNKGQTASTTLVLPTAIEGYSFLAIATDTVAAAFQFQSVDGPVIWFKGVLCSIVGITPTEGDAIRFTAVTGAVYGWLAEEVQGTWTGTP